MIESKDNEKLKLVRKLRERKHREREGLFVTEGEDLLAAGLAADATPRLVLVAAGSAIDGEEVEPALLASVSTLGSGTRAIAVWARPEAISPVGAPCVNMCSYDQSGYLPARMLSSVGATPSISSSLRPEPRVPLNAAYEIAPGVVFTTLTKEALPLMRYRTGDLASLSREPCACGRTFARMSRVLGRTDDMLIIRGVNVFPSEIERALLAIPELEPHYQLVVERPGHLDELTVQVEGSVDPVHVQKELHSALGLTAAVDVVDVEPDDVRCDLPVALTVREVEDGLLLPLFAPA